MIIRKAPKPAPKPVQALAKPVMPGPKPVTIRRMDSLAMGPTEVFKRIRQIGVEMIFQLEPGTRESVKMESYCKELKEILLSIGVPEDELYVQSATPTNGTKEEPIDAADLFQRLDQKLIEFDMLSRKQLIAMAHSRGVKDTETRAKTIKELRQMVLDRMPPALKPKPLMQRLPLQPAPRPVSLPRRLV
jgi:hypothetical protein